MWKIQVFVFSSVAQLCLTLARQASLSITNSQSLTDSCPSHRWCRPTVSSSVIPFFSCPQSFPASGYCIWNFLKLKKIVFDPLLVAPLDSEPAETRRLTELFPVFFPSSCESALLCCVLSLKAEGVCYFIFCLLRNVWNSPSYSPTTQVCTLLVVWLHVKTEIPLVQRGFSASFFEG